MTAPEDRRYSKEHEWVKLQDDGTALVGITHYAQDQLGDIVYLDLPKPGTALTQFEKLGEVESVKAVSDIYAPVSGTVEEVNPDLEDHPELVNQDPYEKGWLLRVRVSDPSQVEKLLTAREYEEYLKGLEH